MRVLLIILCLTFAQAERSGHNIGQGGSHSALESRHRNRIGSASTAATTVSNSNRFRTRLHNGPVGYTGDAIQAENFASPAAIDAGYHKEFYTYTAPEDELKDLEAAQQITSTTRKNIRVVFIKAPQNNALTNAALQLAQKNAESKTAIYVLTKQPDIADLVNQLQTIQPNQDTKPEVHFVKYRTPEDAIRAQQIIQNEFDALGGTSSVSNEGVAPVLDFSSKKENFNSINIGPMNNVAVMLNTFLPSKARQ